MTHVESIAKKPTALMLILCLLTGLMPSDLLSGYIALASASAVYGDDFDWALSASGEERTSGPWRYRLLLPQNYAVITGHTDASATQLAVPATLDGADVVALASGAPSAHNQLETLQLPGNVNALASDAVPRGVTLQGYHATYAHRFAQSSGYPFQSLSQYDFLTGVIDYANIDVRHFQRISAHEMRMRSLEAARLAVGSRFFLVDPANAYQISYYRVTTISAVDDAGFVTLTCETPTIDEVMRSFSGTDEVMMLDLSTLELEEGATLNTAKIPRDTTS